MPSLPSDPTVGAALHRLADEIAALRQTLTTLADENRDLRARLAASEGARADVLAQAEHVLGKLAEAQREIAWRRQQMGEAPST